MSFGNINTYVAIAIMEAAVIKTTLQPIMLSYASQYSQSYHQLFFLFPYAY